MKLNKIVKHFKLLAILLLFLFLNFVNSFSYSGITISNSNNLYNFTVYNLTLPNSSLEYKLDFDYSWRTCNFNFSNINPSCIINVSKFNLKNSKFLYYKFNFDNNFIPKKYNVLSLDKYEDDFSKNYFLKISKNSSKKTSFKCSFIESDYNCQSDDDFAYAILNLIHLYNVEKNSTYLFYINKFISTGITGGSCDYKNNDFICGASVSSGNSGSYSQGIMADMFINLFQLTKNNSYLDYAKDYLISNSENCDVYSGDYSCEDNSNGMVGDDFATLINANLDYFQATGNKKFLDIAINLSDYIISNNYSNSSLALSSLIKTYSYTNNLTYFNFSNNFYSKYSNLCINSNCSLNDYSNSIFLFLNLKFYSQNYLNYNFNSQNVVFKLYSGFNNSCNYINNSFKCDNVFEQGLVSDTLYNIFKYIRNTSEIKLIFPRLLNSRANMLKPINYSVILSGYVDDLKLNTSQGLINTNFKPINKSNYLISNLIFSQEKSEELNYVYNLSSQNYIFPLTGKLKIAVGSDQIPELNLFKIVANNSLKDPNYFCDPFGSNSQKEDFSCKYEHFQSNLLNAFSSLRAINNISSNLNNYFYKNFYNKISYIVGGNHYYTTCDPYLGDFSCQEYSSEFSTVIQKFAKSGSYRQSDMVNSLFQSIIKNNDFDLNDSFPLLNSYLSSNSQDCNISDNNFSCLNLISQGKKLGFLLNKYYSFGDKEDLDTIKSFIDYSIKNNLTNSTFFATNLFKAYSLTNNQTYLSEAENISLNYDNYCIKNSCSVEEKYGMVEMYSSALIATNNNIYASKLNDELISNGNSCDAINYYFQLKSGNNPSTSILNCNFPDQIGMNSNLFSDLYKNFYNPTKRLYIVNLTSNQTAVNYSNSFIVFCNVTNFQNSTIYKQKVRLVTEYNLTNFSVDSNLNYSLINPSDISVLEVDALPGNSTFEFNWTLNANIGGLNSIICVVGDNSSSVGVVSDNIGLVGNLSTSPIISNVVENHDQDLYKIEFKDIPFLLSNISFKFNYFNLSLNYFRVTNVDGNNIDFSYNASTRVLTLKDDLVPSDIIYIYINGHVINDTFAHFNVSLKTNFHGFNNASSSLIHAVKKNLVSGKINILTSTITPGNPYEIEFSILNNISSNNFDYSLDKLKVEIQLLYTSYQYYIGKATYVSGILGQIDTIKNSTIHYVPNLAPNKNSKYKWKIKTNDADYYTDAKLKIILSTENGFYNEIISKDLPFEHIPDSGSGSGSGSSSSSGGGGGSGSSSHNINNIIPKSITSGPEINKNQKSVIDEKKDSKPLKSNSCNLDIVYKFTKSDIKKIFDLNPDLILKIINLDLNKTSEKYKNLGLEILKKSNINSINFNNYFDRSLKNKFSTDKYFDLSLNYSISSLDCLKIHTNIEKTNLTYAIYDFCDVVPSIYLSINNKFKQKIIPSEVNKYGENNYFDYNFLNIINLNKEKNFINIFRLSSNNICLGKSDVTGFFLLDSNSKNKIYTQVLKSTLDKIAKEEKVVIDYSILNNTILSTSKNSINSDLIAKKIISKSNGKGDLTFLKINSIFYLIIIIISLILILVSIMIILYYKFKKIEENMFYLLNLIKSDLKTGDLKSAVYNLNKFYKKYNFYYVHKDIYIKFIPDLEKYFNLYIKLNNLSKFK